MLLERTTLDAIGRPVLLAGEVQQAELDQVGQLATAPCILHSALTLNLVLVFTRTGPNSV